MNATVPLIEKLRYEYFMLSELTGRGIDDEFEFVINLPETTRNEWLRLGFVSQGTRVETVG